MDCILLTERKKQCNIIICYNLMEYSTIIELYHSTLSNEKIYFSLMSFECIHIDIYPHRLHIFALFVFCLILKLELNLPLIVPKHLFSNSLDLDQSFIV